MRVFNGIHLPAAGGYAEGSVLDSLKFLDRGGGGAGEPDGVGVGEEGGNEGFVCEEKGLFALSPGGTSRGRLDVETMGCAGDKGRYGGDKVNMGSKVIPRIPGFSTKGRGEELRVGVGGEERDC